MARLKTTQYCLGLAQYLFSADLIRLQNVTDYKNKNSLRVISGLKTFSVVLILLKGQ